MNDVELMKRLRELEAKTNKLIIAFDQDDIATAINLHYFQNDSVHDLNDYAQQQANELWNSHEFREQLYLHLMNLKPIHDWLIRHQHIDANIIQSQFSFNASYKFDMPATGEQSQSHIPQTNILTYHIESNINTQLEELFQYVITTTNSLQFPHEQRVLNSSGYIYPSQEKAQESAKKWIDNYLKY